MRSESPPARPCNRAGPRHQREKGCPEAVVYAAAACASSNPNHMWAQPRKASEVSFAGSSAPLSMFHLPRQKSPGQCLWEVSQRKSISGTAVFVSVNTQKIPTVLGVRNHFQPIPCPSRVSISFSKRLHGSHGRFWMREWGAGGSRSVSP